MYALLQMRAKISAYHEWPPCFLSFVRSGT